MRVGVIGLGNVGGKLAGSLLAGGVDLRVHDLDADRVAEFVARGAADGGSVRALAGECDMLVTCLPSPRASAEVIEGGVIGALPKGAVWIEMSTSDADEIRRLAAMLRETGVAAADCPVSGGCHRAASGNISIFAGCERPVFERILPLLKLMGREILHTGALGSASLLKVMTNYLATANLLTLCEALVTMKAAGLELGTTYEAIRISSGNSFVHETESQLILNGSRDVSFTMGLVRKDIGLFQQLADQFGVPLEISPQLVAILDDALARYGAGAQSDRIIERLEEATGLAVRAPGFPAELVDEEPREIGREIGREVRLRPR